MSSADRAATSVDVVIVNWNTGPYLRRAVDSVLRSETSTVRVERVVVVDNCSTDASLEGVEDASPAVEVLRNSHNVGFAAGCNQGAARGTAEFVLFLNPDAAVAPDAIERSAGFMTSSAGADVAVCGGTVVDHAGRADCSCARLPTLSVVFGRMTRLSRLLPRWFPPSYLGDDELVADRAVPEVIGAYFFARRAAFDRLGGFDERFFLYYEEVDFCCRAQLCGWRVYFIRDVRAEHAGRVSTDQAKGARLFHSLYSRGIYARTHWPRWQYATLVVTTYLVELPARLVSAALAGRVAAAGDVVLAYRLLLSAHVGARLLPRLLTREAPT